MTAGHDCFGKVLFNGASLKDIAVPLLLATVAQFFFSGIYYTNIVAKAQYRAACVDKGVKTLEGIKINNPSMGCLMVHSLVTAAVRAAAILAVMFHSESFTGVAVGQQSLCMFSQAAVAVFALIGSNSIEENFYAQRPVSLIVINTVNKLGGALVAAVVLFFALRQ